MAVKPYEWVSWSEARSRMPEICSRWSWDREHADKAFVNVLRLRNVSYRGEAHEVDLGLPGKSIRLEDVVTGLLSAPSYGWVKYETKGWSAGVTLGRLHTAPIATVKKSNGRCQRRRTRPGGISLQAHQV